MNLSKHISGASLFLILLLVAIGIFSMIRIYNSRNSIDEVARIDVPLIEHMTNIETHQLEQSISFERAIRYAEEIGRFEEAESRFVSSDSLFRKLALLVDEELLLAETQIKKGIKLAISDNQRIIMKDLLNAVKRMEKEHLTYEKDALYVLDLLIRGKLDEAINRTDEVEMQEESFNKQTELLLIQLEAYTEEIVTKIEKVERATLRMVVLFTCFFVMISVVISILSSSKTIIPIENLKEGVRKVGDGEKDVVINVPPSGITSDLAVTFNEMVVKLNSAQEEIEQHTIFSYSTAHDLKAPVVNLMTLLDRLDKSSDDYEEILIHAKKSGKQINTIVSALNEVNKLRDSFKLDRTLLKFEAMTNEVEKGVATQITEANVIITKWFVNCPEIKYAAAHLQSIYQNLITNAMKYRSLDRMLEIEVRSYFEDGHTVLEVKDNGVGFDSDLSGREVLEPFRQLNTSVEGSGLGLYIIKTIVDNYNGHIEVKSLPDEGSVFTIYLN